MEAHRITPLTSTSLSEDPVDIKCIVFAVRSAPDVKAVVVVLDQSRRVNQKKVAASLERILGPMVPIKRQDISMLSRDLLIDAIGYPVGEVPPFGFCTGGIIRIVDDELVRDGRFVRFGPEEGFVVIRGEDLLKDGGVAAAVGEVADVADRAILVRGTGDPSASGDFLHPIGPNEGQSAFGGVPVQIETILRVVRKRKLAKRLLFATVVPGQTGGRHAFDRNLRSSGSLVWRHPVTGQACELQMIIGKTVERRYGPKVMEQVLKRVVKGGYVRITGVLQANSKNDAVLDVVVHDLETLGSSLIGLASAMSAEAAATVDSSGSSEAPTIQQQQQQPQRPHQSLAHRPKQLPYVNLNTLKMQKKKKKGVSEEDLLPEYGPARALDVVPVSTMHGLVRLREALFAATAVSLDAEWRPSTQSGRSNPVSLLQLGIVGSDSTSMDIFLVDMLALCFYEHDGSFGRALTEEQIVLSDLLEAVFGSDIPKLGFGLRYDVKRLRESYPWLPCFRGHAVVSSHVDVGMLGRLAGKVKAHKNLSLSKLTTAVLGVRLSKEEQMSDWGHRPLDESQVKYASNDVACLMDIYDALVAVEPDILSGKQPREFVSLGLTDLGRASGMMTSEDVDGNGSGSGWYSGSDATWEVGDMVNQVLPRQLAKKQPLKTCTIGPGAARAYLGEYVDRGGKEGAVNALLGTEEAKKYNSAPRGGAIIEMANAFLFFVNIPSRNYPNDFVDGKMSWFSSRGQTLEHPVIKRILGGEKLLTLWCRRDRERYAYFGELSVDSVEEQADGTLKVWYRLNDWETIIASHTAKHVLAGNVL